MEANFEQKANIDWLHCSEVSSENSSEIRSMVNLEVSRVVKVKDDSEGACFLVYGKKFLGSVSNEKLPDSDVFFDEENNVIWFDGKRCCELSCAEASVFVELLNRRGKPVSRDKLYFLIYGEERQPFCRRIDNLVSAVRRKIEMSSGSPEYLVTVRHKGYMLK